MSFSAQRQHKCTSGWQFNKAKKSESLSRGTQYEWAGDGLPAAVFLHKIIQRKDLSHDTTSCFPKSADNRLKIL